MYILEITLRKKSKEQAFVMDNVPKWVANKVLKEYQDDNFAKITVDFIAGSYAVFDKKSIEKLNLEWID